VAGEHCGEHGDAEHSAKLAHRAVDARRDAGLGLWKGAEHTATLRQLIVEAVEDTYPFGSTKTNA
jgi:hypothetical protein